jgi:acyl dehydratase
MEEYFGDGWVRGGTIAVRWVCPVYVNDRITPYGRITAINEVNGKQHVALDVWCQNQSGTKTGIGAARAYLG